MRIAWFSHRYHPCVGGAEIYARQMIRRFAAQGHHVDVFTCDADELWYYVNPRRRRVAAPAVSEVDGATVHRLRIRHFPFQRYVGRLLSYVPHWPTRCRFESYMPIIPGIERVRGDYDAVFAHGFPYTIFSYGAFRTAREAGAPLILTPFLHLSTPDDPYRKFYTRPHQIRLLAESDCVAVVSGVEADAVAGWGIPRWRLLRLRMGVEHAAVTGGDRAAFRARLGIPDNAPVVGQLGALDPNKGATHTLLAVARLNESRPADQRIHLVLAGAPSPDFERFMAGRGDAGTPEWLHLLGPIPDDDRPHFYAALDAFAMPSRTDSFGIVFLEAWANGLPVVGAAAGGVPDVIRHDETGFLVPYGDVDRIADALGRLVDDRPLARSMGERGRVEVATGHTWDDTFQLLRERTETLVDSRRARTPHSPRTRTGRVTSPAP
ncbi:MAG: glycosyltransferase family 4 protein [Isosphaeraceae bacterium]